MNGLARRLNEFLGSRRFFYIVLGFFVFEALWFVFSALYPMAFDEEFHLGIIKIYAEQWSPFLATQPEGAEKFGAVVRDPSYLFHYLMSFPYRFIALFTESQTVQVIILRLMNVAMFVWGLVLYRKVLLRARASQALVNVTLAVFVLIPIVPQLAAHINYDNLFMVLLPLMILAVFALIDGFRKQQINMQALLGFVVLSMAMTLVKYAALPFVLAAVLFLVAMLHKGFKGRYKKLWPAIRKNFGGLSRPMQITLMGLVLIASVLFVQRYGVNLVQYHNPVPDCGKVLTTTQCKAYGPWGRDHYLRQNLSDDFRPNPAAFMWSWLHGMWHRLFFAVSGPTNDYRNYLSLPVPGRTAIAVIVLGLLASLLWWRQAFRGNIYLVLFGVLILIYTGILWYDQYDMYRQTGVPVAINGRYLLPILPLLAAIMGRSIAIGLRKKPEAKPLLATIAIVCLLYGGGLLTFIMRSDHAWYWPNKVVQTVNDTARDVLRPILIEGKKE